MTVEKFKSKRMLCFIAALIATFCAGFGYAWSIIQAAVMGNHPDWAPANIAIAYTLQVTISSMAPLFLGAIIKKLNTRQNVMVGAVLYGVGLFSCGFATSLPLLYLFYGVFAGIGVGFIYPIMMSYAVKVLPDKGSLASGFMAAAYGMGAVVWAPVADKFITAFSLNTTFKILGAIFFIAIICMSLFLSDVPAEYITEMSAKAVKKDSAAPVKHVVDRTRGEMAKTGTFYIMLLTYTFATTCGMLVISQAKSIVVNTCGDSLAASAALCVSVVTLFNTFGRIIWGAVSQKIGCYNVTAILFVISACCMTGLAFADNGVLIVALMAITASCFGGSATMITPVTADMFGMKHLTENFGVMYIVYAFSSFIGPRLATSLMTTSPEGVVSYAKAYIVGAVISVIGVVLAFVLKNIDKKNQQA